MKNSLSPAAQAVITAYDKTFDQRAPRPGWSEACLAAALRAAAVYCKRDALALLCIADELEAQ